MQNKNEQIIFKRKKIKEEVSLPHLYPPPPFGRGRIKEGEGVLKNYWKTKFNNTKGRTKEGEGDNNNQTVTKLVVQYI